MRCDCRHYADVECSEPDCENRMCSECEVRCADCGKPLCSEHRYQIVDEPYCFECSAKWAPELVREVRRLREEAREMKAAFGRISQRGYKDFALAAAIGEAEAFVAPTPKPGTGIDSTWGNRKDGTFAVPCGR